MSGVATRAPQVFSLVLGHICNRNNSIRGSYRTSWKHPFDVWTSEPALMNFPHSCFHISVFSFLWVWAAEKTCCVWSSRAWWSIWMSRGTTHRYTHLWKHTLSRYHNKIHCSLLSMYNVQQFWKHNLNIWMSKKIMGKQIPIPQRRFFFIAHQWSGV